MAMILKNEIVMRRMLKFILMMCCAALLCGCSNIKLRRQMKDFMAHKIVLPQELMEICDGRTRPVCVSVDSPMLILFYGKNECSLCAINHLADDLDEIKMVEKSGQCKVLILFSLTTEDDQIEIPEQIRESKFSFPIYLDLYGDFYRYNAEFPNDARFHSFLVGTDGYPVFIGNPLKDSRLRKVFNETLENI